MKKKIESGIFSLHIKDATVYVKGIKIATIEELNLFTLLFYSSVKIEALKIDESLKSFTPLDINKTVIMHSVLSPFKAFVTSIGSFGMAEGIIDLDKRSIRMDIIDANDIKAFKSQLKKGEKGLYYETSF